MRIHRWLVESLDTLPNLPQDHLRIVLKDLGPVTNEIAAKGPGSEISLNLWNRFLSSTSIFD